MVGLQSADDAAVWAVDAQRALVLTSDFFTPVVDDAYSYGAIAAANALSDVYAMGGKPFLALNLAALPGSLPLETTRAILRGGAEKAREAGCVIAGGHSVRDDEPKYGLAVLGWVHPQKMLRKGSVAVGDRLYLSKPLGMGVTTTAHKQEIATPQAIEEASYWMMRLNAAASQAAVEAGLHAATDITGFGLIGHAWEMAAASGLGLRLKFAELPFIAPAKALAQQYLFPGGAYANAMYYGEFTVIDPLLEEWQRMLLFDPQTSGGLLIAVAQEQEPAFLAAARALDQPLWLVGEAVTGDKIEVLP